MAFQGTAGHQEPRRRRSPDPDHAQRDLFKAIAEADFHKWNVFIQVMTDDQAQAWEARTGWNPFDITKIWPHSDFPRIPVGVLELNRNPDNYHADVEQVAFSPANVLPGMGYSPDKMLQGRLFAYDDAHLYRVGTNHQHLPVNQPRCPFHNQQRDGAMATPTSNGYAQKNYATVVAGGTATTGLGHDSPGLALEGDAAYYDERGASDDFTQAGNLFRLMTPEQRNRLASNIAGHWLAYQQISRPCRSAISPRLMQLTALWLRKTW